MKANVTFTNRMLNDSTAVIDIEGEVTSFAEDALMGAYNAATTAGAKSIILNFERLSYMNSSGIGLLVTLLIRANRQKQQLSACGLTDHYRQIFELTRLNEAILIHENEAEALAAV